MKKLFLLNLLVFACPGFLLGNASAATVQVNATSSLTFSPKTVTINAGDTIKWVNQTSSITHTTTSGKNCTPDGIWNQSLSPGASFSLVFNTAGTFPYFCIPHCLSGMTGTITVTGATFSISGTVSGAVQQGVTMTLSGTSSATTTTDASGNYSFSGLSNGSYTVTPSTNGFTFAPASSPATINNANVTGINFTASSTGGTCTTFDEVIAKYNLYVNGQAVWEDVINCYTLYVNQAAKTATTATAPGGFSFDELLSIPPEVLLFSDDWPLANKDYNNTRATFTSKINSKNVSKLQVAWTFEIPGISTFGAAATNPLIVGNRVYLQDLKSNVYAFHLGTGKLIWLKVFNVDNIGPNGPAVGWGKIFITRGADVIALDMKGNELWTTTLTENPNEGTDFQLTAWGNLVYVSTVPGASVINFYTGGTVGFIHALDQQTGAIQWSFSTVDTPDIWGNPTINSGGGAWYPPAIDMKTGITYWGIANPAPFPGTPDFPNGSSRPGPNLYTDSMLALDAKTGALKWYNQVKPHDLFDLDFQLSPVLASAKIGGVEKEIVIGGGKLGKVTAFDRATGEMLWQTPVGEHQNDDLTELPEGTTRVFPGVFGANETCMALAGDIVYVPVLNIFTDYTPTSIDQTTLDIAGGTGELVAIDVKSGDILWDNKFNSPNFGAATVVNDLVFTSTFDGKIYAFDRMTGNEIWSYQASGGINAWPAVAGDTIIFPVGQGNPPQLVAFRLKKY
jgi:outer membrane protein assembly factor BamB/plastocyanin